MFKVVNKYTGKEYGMFTCSEEAETFAKMYSWLIVCNMSLTKEEKKEEVKSLWKQLETAMKLKRSKLDLDGVSELRKRWMKADFKYTALYNEEY